MKKIAYSIFVLCSLLAAGIYFLPLLLSTPFGKSSLTTLLSKKNKEIQVDSLHLSWLGPQIIAGLSFTDTTHRLSGHVQKITIQSELWNLLLSRKDLKKTLISQPSIELKSKPKSPPSKINSPQPVLSTASIPPSSKRILKKIKKSAPFIFKGHLTVEKGVIEITLKDAEKIKFLDIEAVADIPTYSLPKSIKVSCQTFQNNSYGKAHINASVTDEELIEIQATAHQLPIRGIDNLLSLEFPQIKGLLYQAIGSSLDLKLDGLLSSKSFNLSLSASSPHLLAEIQTKKEGDLITFLSPATISLNLSPPLLENLLKLADLPPLTFQANTQLHIKVPSFTLPLKKRSPDFSHCALSGELTLSPTSFTIPKLDKTIHLTSFKTTFSSKDIQDQLQAQLDLTLTHLDKEASVNIQGELSSLTNGKATAHISHFPTALLDKKHYTSLFFGNTLDLDIQSTWEEAFTNLQFHLSTPNLEIQKTSLTIKDRLTLDAPTEITYTPPKQLLDFLKLEKTIPIDELSSAKLTINSLTLQDLTNLHSLALKGKLHAKDLKGHWIDFSDLTCLLHIDNLDKIRCELESPTLQTELYLALNSQMNSLEFKKPTHIKYLVTQNLFHSLLPSPKLEPILERPSLSDITLEPFSLPLTPSATTSLLLKGKGTLDALIFKSPSDASLVSLEEIKFAFTIDQKNDKLTCSLKEIAKIDGQNSGSIDLSFELKDPFTPNTFQVVDGKGQIKHLKTQVLDTIFGLHHPLLPILGPTLNLSLETTKKPDSVQFHLNAQSQYLKGTGYLNFSDDGTISSHKPSTLQWTLTPETLSFLSEMSNLDTAPPFTLTAPSTLDITLSHFTLPHNFDLSSIQGEFHLNSLSMQERGKGETLTLGQLAGTFEKKSETPLKFSMKGKSAPSGDLTFQGTLHNLCDAQGNLTLNEISTDLDGEIRQFPTPFVDLFSRSLMQKDLHLTTLLGDTINASLKAQIEGCCGEVHLNFNTDHAKASLDGKLKEGTLTLTAPLYAQFQIGKESSTLLLEHANPLGISSFTSNAPITLEISEKGFSLPLFPLNLKQINIGEARLELGKITCGNQGNLKSVLKLLKSRQLAQDKTLELWFTSINMHIHQGILDANRTEIFVNNLLELALWGTINFPKDKVNMVLGLTPHTLKKAFHIKKLPSDYVLHIPLTGPTNHVTYDKVKATAKIASLLAWQYTSKDKSNDSLWGDLLQAVGTLPDKNAKTPPAQKPLPWDKKKKTAKKLKNKKKKAKNQPVSDPEPPPNPRLKNTNPFKDLFRALR